MSILQLWFFANTILWAISFYVITFNILLSELVLIVAGLIWFAINRRISASSVKISLLLLAYFVFSFGAAFIGPCTDGFGKSAVTAPMLAFLVLFGWEIGHKASWSDWSGVPKAAIWALLLEFAAFFVEFMMPAWFPHQEGARYGGRLSGMFTEPSHVGFALFPCVAILLVSENSKTRKIGWLALAILLLASRSSTLILMLVAWILYRLLIQRKLRQAAALILVFGSAIVVGSVINYDKLIEPTIDRIVGVSESNDLQAAGASSLVYLQGWEDAWANLIHTRGLGLGFNRMGCSPIPDVPARTVLFLETGHMDLSAEDGSFLFAKVVSESGVFGIAFYVAVFWWWFRLERKLHLYPQDPGHLAATMQAALIFCFVTASFIRSMGYFTGTFLLLVVAISASWKWQQCLPAKPRNEAVSGQA